MSLHEVPWACMQFHEFECSSFLCLSSSQEFRSACFCTNTLYNFYQYINSIVRTGCLEIKFRQIKSSQFTRTYKQREIQYRVNSTRKNHKMFVYTGLRMKDSDYKCLFKVDELGIFDNSIGIFRGTSRSSLSGLSPQLAGWQRGCWRTWHRSRGPSQGGPSSYFFAIIWISPSLRQSSPSSKTKVTLTQSRPTFASASP